MEHTSLSLTQRLETLRADACKTIINLMNSLSIKEFNLLNDNDDINEENDDDCDLSVVEGQSVNTYMHDDWHSYYGQVTSVSITEDGRLEFTGRESEEYKTFCGGEIDMSDTALLDIIARLENYIEHKNKKG